MLWGLTSYQDAYAAPHERTPLLSMIHRHGLTLTADSPHSHRKDCVVCNGTYSIPEETPKCFNCEHPNLRLCDAIYCSPKHTRITRREEIS